MMRGTRIARPIWNPELAVLTVLSLVFHFARLFTPNAVLFDEAHYKRFAGQYLVGTFYYDVHPPLANLTPLRSPGLLEDVHELAAVRGQVQV